MSDTHYTNSDTPARQTVPPGVFINTNILRLPEVMRRVGLKRASIYLHMAQGTFPKQIHLGDRAVGWLESEIATLGWRCA